MIPDDFRNFPAKACEITCIEITRVISNETARLRRNFLHAICVFFSICCYVLFDITTDQKKGANHGSIPPLPCT
jgi:hypothetical protein